MIALRSDSETEQKLRDTASRLKKTKTEILREALEAYMETPGVASRRKAKRSASLPIQEHLGVWDGPPDSSVNTGRQFGDLQIESQRARRV